MYKISFMRSLILSGLFFIFASSTAALTPLEKHCQELKKKIELEQFSYHNTVARLTLELRVSSTPGTMLNIEKIDDYISSLKKSKVKLNKLTSDKQYNKCI